MAKTVKEAIAAKKLEYSRFKADFQENGSSGGCPVLKLGNNGRSFFGPIYKSGPEFFPQKLFFGKDDPFIEQSEGIKRRLKYTTRL